MAGREGYKEALQLHSFKHTPYSYLCPISLDTGRSLAMIINFVFVVVINLQEVKLQTPTSGAMPMSLPSQDSEPRR